MESGASERYKESVEKVDCPFCGKGKITVSFISGWVEWKVSRIAAGAKRTKFYHDPKTIVHEKCPSCGASKTDIKGFLETGKTKKESNEDRLKRIKAAGLPTVIERHL